MYINLAHENWLKESLLDEGGSLLSKDINLDDAPLKKNVDQYIKTYGDVSITTFKRVSLG